MDYLRLSKELSYALRHAPHEYSLVPDDDGWVEIEQLLSAFRKKEEWRSLSEHDFLLMIEKSEKKRHEISGKKIRAMFGHSLPKLILRDPEDPPEVLYHGTAERNIESIMSEGLSPRSRQYAHLSTDLETAFQTGIRHDDAPVVLRVHALKAWNEGVKFYHANENIWLADRVPAQYIEVENSL